MEGLIPGHPGQIECPNQHFGGPIVLEFRPKGPRWAGYVVMPSAPVLVCGGIWLWASGYRPPFLESGDSQAHLALMEIDQGDVLESSPRTGSRGASNTVVKCEVEALLGMVGGRRGAALRRDGQPVRKRGNSTSGQGGTATESGQGTAGTRAGRVTTPPQPRGQRQSEVEGRGDQEAGSSGSKRAPAGAFLGLRFLRVPRGPRAAPRVGMPRPLRAGPGRRRESR